MEVSSRKVCYVLDFPPDKEVVLFECAWFDVPPANRTESKGYKKDKYGIVDLDTTLHRFQGDPETLTLQASKLNMFSM